MLLDISLTESMRSDSRAGRSQRPGSTWALFHGMMTSDLCVGTIKAPSFSHEACLLHIKEKMSGVCACVYTQWNYNRLSESWEESLRRVCV